MENNVGTEQTSKWKYEELRIKEMKRLGDCVEKKNVWDEKESMCLNQSIV